MKTRVVNLLFALTLILAAFIPLLPLSPYLILFHLLLARTCNHHLRFRGPP